MTDSTCQHVSQLCDCVLVQCDPLSGTEKHFLLSPFECEQLLICISGRRLALLGTPPCVLMEVYSP